MDSKLIAVLELLLDLQHSQTKALQEIASALERISNPRKETVLGLCNPPLPQYLFIGGDNDSCWYTLDKDNRQVPITFNAITGRITNLTLVDRQYKNDTNTKLDIGIAADKDYVLRTGLGTIASRCILLSLWQLPPQSLREVLTIAVKPGTEGKVVFAEVYQGGSRIQYEWLSDADLMQITRILQDRLNPGF
jgi:hypothetical protein